MGLNYEFHKLMIHVGQSVGKSLSQSTKLIFTGMPSRVMRESSRPDEI